ncbi:diacylglycerol O-acyltransferase 2-like protein 6 isoform X2 [Halyomorpha halys]|nr:diacylglycerol O-acyltransferase 2-like protein 6 isoform X2 [Halyomorpha halys]
MEKKIWKTMFQDFLELLSAAFYSFHLFIHIYSAILLLYIAFWTNYWPIVAIAACWMSYDYKAPSRGGRQVDAVKRFPIWKYFNNYFPIRLVKTADLDPKRNYIFCTHPHGVICTSNVAHFILGYSKASQLFPGLKFHTATLNINFCFPILRDYALALGFISASKDSLMYLLRDNQGGNVVNLMIGGSSEAYFTEPGDYRIILNKRKGFIRIALNTGCSLVPVFCFGENDTLQLVFPKPDSIMGILQDWFRRLTRVSLCFPVGRSWLLTCVPKRTPMVTVVGEPINIPKITKPSEEDIEYYHSIYKEALMRLFEESKFQYTSNPTNTKLIIVG